MPVLELREGLALLGVAVIALSCLVTGLMLCGLLPRREEHPGALRFAAAAGIGADLFLALLLLDDVLRAPLGGVKAHGLTALCALALQGLSLLGRTHIFPDDTDIFTRDQVQRGKLRSCLWCLLGLYLVQGIWLLFLLVHTGGMRQGECYVLLGYSLLTLAAILGGSHLAVRTIHDRIEALVDRQYQAELLNMMQLVRSQRHDFNFHMQVVSGMIESRRYDECDSYIRTMMQSVERVNDVLPLNSPAVSALVNTFQEMADSRNIRLELQLLDDLGGLPCTDYEVNTILGNLLQNAVDEVSTALDPGKRWIHLLIMKRSRRHLIKVSNPCSRAPEEFGEVFRAGYSTKQSHEGIGLATVKRITGRYGGTVYLEHEEGVVHFIASVPLKKQESGGNRIRKAK